MTRVQVSSGTPTTSLATMLLVLVTLLPALERRKSYVFVAIDRTGKPVRVPEAWRTLLPHWPEDGESRSR